jgi:hypothetical protein
VTLPVKNEQKQMKASPDFGFAYAGKPQEIGHEKKSVKN